MVHRLGWDVYTRYGVVLCYDPEVALQGPGGVLPPQAGSEDELSTQDQRLLLEFEASDESDETPESIGFKMGYFNGEAPQTVTQEGTFKRYKFNTDQVIRNKDEATVYESAYNLADSYDTQKASARLFGEADLYPGMGVDVTTSNYRIYKGRFDGRWLIDAVTHKMDRSSFQTQVKLSRPGKAADPGRSLPVVLGCGGQVQAIDVPDSRAPTGRGSPRGAPSGSQAVSGGIQ